MNAKAIEAQEAIQGDRLISLVAAGQSIAGAARQLEMDYEKARKLYHKELRAVYDSNVGLREELLGKELKTLDLLQRPLMLEAMKGDRKCAETVLSIMDRRAKYLDLHAAAKVNVEITRVDDALREIVTIIDGNMSAASLERIALPEAG
jgi:hypothetical protein